MIGLLLLLLIAEILAIARTKGSLRLYFLAQLVSTLATWFGERAFGLSSNHYRIIYVTVTIPILAASLWICWQAHARLALVTGALLGSCGLLFTIHHQKSLDFWIVLVEGCLLLFLGTSLGLRAPFERDARLAALAVLWLLMAVYDFHWLMNPRVLWLDLMMPTYLVCAACLFCIIYSPSPRQPLTAPPHDY